MLGGMLRALLAMCFNNVVFPLLSEKTNTQEGQPITSSLYYYKDLLLNTYQHASIPKFLEPIPDVEML